MPRIRRATREPRSVPDDHLSGSGRERRYELALQDRARVQGEAAFTLDPGGDLQFEFRPRASSGSEPAS